MKITKENKKGSEKNEDNERKMKGEVKGNKDNEGT